jgi:hypothetical protein
MSKKPEPMLWLSDARGQYIPRDFASSFADRSKTVMGVTQEDWAILDAGPDHEYYWDTWSEVCDNAVITDDNGDCFNIHQEGDCWLIPDGMEWSEEEDFFVWPAEEPDPDRLREDRDERRALAKEDE